MIIVVTSLSPKHRNFSIQVQALDSWKQVGDCYSLNTRNEILQLFDLYSGKVCFVNTERLIQHLIGKCLVNINAMIDFAIELDSDLFLINSDIIIDKLPELKDDGITIFSRYDYTDQFENCIMFEAGFDAMYIPNRYLNIFPQSIYAMGCSFWDYWLPCVAIQNNVTLYYPKGKFIYHKFHETQYSYDEWVLIGTYFKKEFGLEEKLTIPQVATFTLTKIKAHLI